MSQDTILEEIRIKRERQDVLWGAEHDDQNTLNDWVTWIMIYAGQAARMDSTPWKQRDKMLKVAALATAAIESFDRNGEFAPRHFEKAQDCKHRAAYSSLQKEIVIIRAAIEQLMRGIATDEDLLQRSASLNALMLTMDRLVRTAAAMEHGEIG